jgi:hypothetical protein
MRDDVWVAAAVPRVWLAAGGVCFEAVSRTLLRYTSSRSSPPGSSMSAIGERSSSSETGAAIQRFRGPSLVSSCSGASVWPSSSTNFLSRAMAIRSLNPTSHRVAWPTCVPSAYPSLTRAQHGQRCVVVRIRYQTACWSMSRIAR